jgi:hypothetical protein
LGSNGEQSCNEFGDTVASRFEDEGNLIPDGVSLEDDASEWFLPFPAAPKMKDQNNSQWVDEMGGYCYN